MITAYRHADPARGRDLMNKLITSLSHAVPAALVELRALGRALEQRAVDVLATSSGQAPSNGPPRPSTAASNTSAAPPSASETSPTKSPDRYSRPAIQTPATPWIVRSPFS